MKVVFVGGGSIRTVGILRGALAEPGIFEGGEISLYDLNVSRAEAVGQMIKKTPEWRRVGCKVTWGADMGQALDGADMVGVILPACTAEAAWLGDSASYRRGYIPSDNVSVQGAFLGARIVPVVLNIARKMEKHCPRAWLVDFANPVAVASAAVNNHTKIRALGVCGGYTNHQWDLARIFGEDNQSQNFDVETAGVNHLSFIVKGTVKGRELFAALDRRLNNQWKMCHLQSYWSPGTKRMIMRSVTNLVRFYRELGALIFSTEGDGMMHLYYDEYLHELAPEIKNRMRISRREMAVRLKAGAVGRQAADAEFRGLLTQDLTAEFWKEGWQKPGRGWAKRMDHDIFVDIMRGMAGIKRIKLVASRPNEGAVEGFSDRTALEYSLIFENGKIKAAGRYQVPAVVHGMVSSLAIHQTMLSDAIATDDPQLLARALMCYPIRSYASDLRTLCRELAEIHAEALSPALRRVGEYL